LYRFYKFQKDNNLNIKREDQMKILKNLVKWKF